MMQQIIIFLVFVAAAFYLGRVVYRNFSSKSDGCAKAVAPALLLILRDKEEYGRRGTPVISLSVFPGFSRFFGILIISFSVYSCSFSV
jgi:hypothetical protein